MPEPDQQLIQRLAQQMCAGAPGTSVEVSGVVMTRGFHGSSEPCQWCLFDAGMALAALADLGYAVIPAGPDNHIIELTEDGWTLQHPLDCRPDLFACPFNRAAEQQATIRPGTGRYECWLDGDELIIGERIEVQP